MRLFAIVLICITVLFLMLSYYKKSKYQRSANIPNGIVSLICMAVIFLSPVFTEPLNLSTSGEAITISQNGNIQIYEIDGQDTKNQSITVDIGKMYLNVLLVDRTYQDLFEGFTFSEKANITYGLYYNEVLDGFYLYRNFGQAMGVDIWAFVALILLTYNLVLMVLRVLRLKNDPEESSVFKASSLQRMVNMLERSSMIAFSAIGLGYLLSIFITPKIGFLYYFTDAQYLLFISAVLLLPLLISIVVELFHRNYSVEFENHIINIYEKKSWFFLLQIRS